MTTLPPSHRDDIPLLRVPRNALVRVHLGFRASRVSARIGAAGVATRRGASIVEWRATRAGLVLVTADGAKGDASYLVRLRLS